MKTFEATITREGKWWMVAVPEIDGLTQARRITEAPLMARELIAVTLDLDLEDIEVNITSVAVGEHEDVSADAAVIRELYLEAANLELKASREAEFLAKDLAAAGVPLRDVGAILGVSHQRAQQIVTR